MATTETPETEDRPVLLVRLVCLELPGHLVLLVCQAHRAYPARLACPEFPEYPARLGLSVLPARPDQPVRKAYQAWTAVTATMVTEDPLDQPDLPGPLVCRARREHLVRRVCLVPPVSRVRPEP